MRCLGIYLKVESLVSVFLELMWASRGYLWEKETFHIFQPQKVRRLGLLRVDVWAWNAYGLESCLLG